MSGGEKRVRVIHVGVANRGTWPLKKCNEETGFQSVGLVDVNPAALASAREMTGLGESACFGSLEAAMKGVEAECVIACVPTRFHVPLAKEAIGAGKAVLIEKGMAPDWASARDLALAVATTREAVAAVAQNYRYNGMERSFRRAVHDRGYAGYVGAVHHVHYTQFRVRPVVGTLGYPFACVWDMSCHHLDTLMSWFGPVERATARGWRAGWSAYEGVCNTSAILEFSSGVVGTYTHTHDAGRNLLEIQMHGERGVIRASGGTYCDDGRVHFSARPTEQFGSRPVEALPVEAGDGETDLLRDFQAYITRGVEPGISVRNNLETMAACEMLVRSITQGRTVSRSELEEG